MVAESVALQQIAKVRAGSTLWRWFRESRHSELIVVLGEDLTAVSGLSLALIALFLTMATDNPLYDACGSIAVGMLLIIVASGLAIEIKSLLIGESASPSTQRSIREFMATCPGVVELTSLVTLQQGEELFVAIQARIDTALSGRELMRAIAREGCASRRASAGHVDISGAGHGRGPSFRGTRRKGAQPTRAAEKGIDGPGRGIDLEALLARGTARALRRAANFSTRVINADARGSRSYRAYDADARTTAALLCCSGRAVAAPG
jgi:hypothetical protein